MASKSDLKEMVPLTTLKDVSAQEDHDEQIAEIVEKSSGGLGFLSRPRRRVLIVLAVVVLAIIIVGVLVGTILRGNSDTDSGKEESASTLQGKEVEELFSSSPSPETVTKIYPSASVFDTSAHEVQATRTVVSELAPSVKKPHSHTTASGYVLSSIRQLVPNTEAKWSRWGTWSVCTKTCGNGTRVRTRTCIAQNQRAVFAPIFCAGKPLQEKNCSLWSCPDCSKTCVKGTLNAACDACTCDSHVITGRVQSKNGAPISEVSISLAETPYKVLAQTNDSGFFIALNTCTSEELLFTKVGFVPVKLTAAGLTSTTANVNAKLEIAVPPSITVHPRSKMRISGQGVTLCCDGEGNPNPEFEWFKENNIIDEATSKSLEISNVSGLNGTYRCRVVNDYGADFSDTANLKVFGSKSSGGFLLPLKLSFRCDATSSLCNSAPRPSLPTFSLKCTVAPSIQNSNAGDTVDDALCSPIPTRKNATLPAGCVIDGTTNNIVDVGECIPRPCLRNDSWPSNTTCEDETLCCGVEEVGDVTVSCGSSVTFTVSKVTRCGCQECFQPQTRITGVVVGLKGATEKPVPYCDLTFEGYTYSAEFSGFFDFEVPKGKERLTVVFKDNYDYEYAGLTKVFHIKEGQRLFSKIVLRSKPVAKPFNSSEPFTISLGESPVPDSAFAEIEIPEGSLLKDDGTIYSGQANLRMNVMDPRNLSDIQTAPADFSTIDEDGDEQLLVSYGMLDIDFEDESGNPLFTSKPIKISIDPEKMNISVDSNGNTNTKLWWLDPKSGRWVKAGDLWTGNETSRRRKRSPTRFLLETEITPAVARQGKLNIDVRENFGAVRVYAPASSSVRILCEQPNSRPKRYLGYLEKSVDTSRVACISVWIDKTCFMQGENQDSLFLIPTDPDSFPPEVSASIVSSNLTGSTQVESFQFEVKTSRNGPVFTQSDQGLQDCNEPYLTSKDIRQFVFDPPQATNNLELASQQITDRRDPRNWIPANTRCFIKILLHGKRSTFLASSHRPNKGDKFGDSVSLAEPVTAGLNKYVACPEIRCPGNVFDTSTGRQVEEWTHVLVTHLTAKSCDFHQHHLPNQDNIDRNGAACPTRSKRHSPGAETWLCVPLSRGGFDIDNVYTSNRNFRELGVKRCKNGNRKWETGETPDEVNVNLPTVEFNCS